MKKLPIVSTLNQKRIAALSERGNHTVIFRRRFQSSEVFFSRMFTFCMKNWHRVTFFINKASIH